MLQSHFTVNDVIEFILSALSEPSNLTQLFGVFSELKEFNFYGESISICYRKLSGFGYPSDSLLNYLLTSSGVIESSLFYYFFELLEFYSIKLFNGLILYLKEIIGLYSGVGLPYGLSLDKLDNTDIYLDNCITLSSKFAFSFKAFINFFSFSSSNYLIDSYISNSFFNLNSNSFFYFISSFRASLTTLSFFF